MSNQIKRGALISYCTVAFNALAGLLYTPWMVSSIGTSDYGLYTIAISVVSFLLMDFGLGDSVSRFLSKFYADGEENRIPIFLGNVYKLFLVLAAVVGVVITIIVLFAEGIYGNLGAAQVEKLRVLLGVVGIYSVLSFPFLPFKGILIANELFVGLNLCNLFQRVCTVLLIVVCLMSGLGVFSLVFVNGFCVLLFTLIKYLIVRTKTDARADLKSWNWGEAKSLFGFSVWVTVIQICQRMIFSIAPTIIAAMSSSDQVALFGLATSLEGYVWSVSSALNGMFMPRVARISTGDGKSLEQLMIRVGRIQLIIIGLIIAGFALFGRRFVVCWMGSGYDSLYTCTLLIIIPSFLELPQLIGDTAMVVGEHVKSKAIIYITMATANLTLLPVLAHAYGAIGAAVAVLLAYTLRTLLMDYAYHKYLGIRLARFIGSVYTKWLAVTIPLFVCSALISWRIPLPEGWIGLFMQVGCFTIVYSFCMYLFFMNESEKDLIPFRRNE